MEDDSACAAEDLDSVRVTVGAAEAAAADRRDSASEMWPTCSTLWRKEGREKGG